MDELKPCPFCGGEAELQHERDNFSWAFIYSSVRCTKCGAKGERFMQSPKIASGKEAAKAWNRRFTDEK